MTDLRHEMTEATKAAAAQLARIRGSRRVDAAFSVAQSFSENLRSSRGTSSEPYWQAMCNVADSIVAQETGSR